MTAADAPYELMYWPVLQGRGEFVRLALEDAGAAYVDLARGQGPQAVIEFMQRDDVQGVYAPPILRVGELLISQTSNILMYLAPRLGLVPENEAARLRANQLQLTVMDVTAEAHNTHHPVSTSLYYEDQKDVAIIAANGFVQHRLRKYLAHLEACTVAGGFTVGGAHTYVDLSVFHLLCGLGYAFPKAMSQLEGEYPHLEVLKARIESRPRVQAYLQSERRLPFNEDGVFRYYEALDVPL
ncbi:MAG: glutathione S-transferase [Bradymonadia bacterium]